MASEPQSVGQADRTNAQLKTTTVRDVTKEKFTMRFLSTAVLSLSTTLLATTATSKLSAQQQSTQISERNPYPHATEPIGTIRQIYDGVLTPEMAVNTFRNIDRLFPTRTVPRSSIPMPLPPASVPLKNVDFSVDGKHYDLDDYLDLNRVAALLVLKDGHVKLELYRYGNTEKTRWMSMSVAKSITSTLIGAALKQGYISSLSDNVIRYIPSLAGCAYDGVSVRDVITMSSGVQWDETYTDPSSDRRHLLEAQISQVPGSALTVMKELPRIADPGTVNNYNTGETLIAAQILRGAVGKPLATYLFERIWSKYGMEADANWWLDSQDGTEIGGSGFSATLRDYGRFGLFFLNGGFAAGEAILPADWTREATTPKFQREGKTMTYGYLWWMNKSPASRRDGAFMGIGIHGQILYVNPVAKVVIVQWGAQPQPLAGIVIDRWLFCEAVTETLMSE